MKVWNQNPELPPLESGTSTNQKEDVEIATHWLVVLRVLYAAGPFKVSIDLTLTLTLIEGP